MKLCSSVYKHKKHLCISVIFILLCINSINAQSVGVEAGYTFNKRNLGYLGGSLSLSNEKRPYSQDQIFQVLIGAGAYYGKFNGESKFIPVGSIGLSTGTNLLYEAKFTVSEYFLNPSIGINLGNIIKINPGYSISLKEINNIKMSGPTISIILSFGTKGYIVDFSN